MLDPDYRRSPWNRSKYAPKNSGNKRGTAISQLVGNSAIVIGTIAFFLLPMTVITEKLIASLVIAMIFYIVFGVFIINGERKRLEKLVKAEEKTSQHNKVTRPIAPRSIELEKMSSREFEEFVAYLIMKQTPYRAEVTGGANDKGVDIKVWNAKELVGIVQCKRYNPDKALPPSFIRELVTVKNHHRVDIAYLATTARFSQDSLREAEHFGIKLIDGNQLKAMYAKAHYLFD